MARKTKAEQLNALAAEIRSDDQYEFFVEFRPGLGWYAMPDESRWIADEGEYLGANYEDAKKKLIVLLA